MLRLHDVFMIWGVFCSFITSFLLFFKSSYHRHANRQLSIILFSCGWYAFIYLLFIGGGLERVPYIFRLGSPLYYLIPPLSYLYVRSTLYNETSFKRSDWLHFIPAVVNLIDLMPFYFADIELKREAVRSIARDLNMSYMKGSGLIPSIIHATLRPIQGVIYFTFQWLLLAKFAARKSNRQLLQRERLYWLFSFSAFLTLMYLSLGVITIIGWVLLGTGSNIIEIGKIPVLIMNLAFFGFSVYLLFKPSILYGIRMNQDTSPDRNLILAKEDPVPAGNLHTPITPIQVIVSENANGGKKELQLQEEQVKIYCAKLEEYISGQQAFRQQGLTLNSLSETLDIPRHHLSYLLNRHYEQRFTDFINTYRVEYIRLRMTGEDWKELTLEALAEEAGFSSRSTFFAAFKKNTGLSPSEYQKQQSF
ncbi:MAG: helix-turn-helix domain-containing protein [Chitinophagaceae bacterium]